MRKIAFVNHKGGVGKTTSAVNIAAGMASRGLKVLAVDTDPQSNLTESFGLFNVEKSIYESFKNGKPLPLVKVKENLTVVPCSLDFAGIELEIAARVAREKTLVELLEPLEKDFDVCIMDCPPSLGIITLNVLVAADEVYIPMQAEFLAYRGIDSIISIITKVKKYFNPKIDVKGVFFTRYAENKVLSRGIKEQLSKELGNRLLETAVRVNVSLAESQADGKDIFEYAPKSNGAEDYRLLVEEMISIKN
jgi:chromosome partitioning protein